MADFILNWLVVSPAFAVPFALAALGLIVAEKSGVLFLGAEGFMLVGAMTGAGALIVMGGHPLLALIAAMLAAALVSLIFAFLVVVLRVDQIIAGLSMVFLCQGLTSLISTLQGWTNRPISGLDPIALWPLSELPILGRLLFHQDVVIYATIAIFVAFHVISTRTLLGLRLKAVGENPDAADAAGVNVVLYRFCAVLCGAALIGLAGAYLSVGVAKIWVDGMAGGRGWIAIALVIFARWQPWRALAGAVLFGCIEALIPRIAAAGIQVPQYFMLMTPYVATLAVMIWAALLRSPRTGQPASLGTPFVREERR